MRTTLRTSVVLICLTFLFLPAVSFSQDPLRTNKDKKGRLHLVVTGGDKAKPVSGADVTVRSGDGEFVENTNTNAQGAANISNVPFGSIVVQVVAMEWKTIGVQYDFKEGRSFQVNLEPAQNPRPQATPTPK